MGMFDRWNLGAKALAAMRWAGDVAQSIDPEAALKLAWKVVEIERGMRGQPGKAKLTELLQWFATNYPDAGAVSVVIGYVKAIVDLLNAVGVFRKGDK
jgi:hypothetical protein